MAIALLVGTGGCSTSDATGSDAGGGGTTGSGGAAGTGGASGSGGSTGSGGVAGTGGASGSGGAGLDAATDRDTGPSADAGAAPTFTEIFSTILESKQSCANGYCHGAGTGGVYLTSKEMAYATLVPAKVIASNPNGSILIQRLTTTNTDQRMPKGGSPLSGAEIEKVRAWILAGAPNN